MKPLGIGSDRFGTRMESSQTTIAELGNESYQKQPVANNHH